MDKIVRGFGWMFLYMFIITIILIVAKITEKETIVNLIESFGIYTVGLYIFALLGWNLIKEKI